MGRSPDLHAAIRSVDAVRAGELIATTLVPGRDTNVQVGLGASPRGGRLALEPFPHKGHPLLDRPLSRRHERLPLSPLIPKALAVSLAFSLAGLPPARATIVQAEPDTDSDLLAELASHQAGARHKAVAAIHLTDEKGAVRLVSGSGTYIGASRDGRKGLVLTAAHLFGYDPKAPAPLNYGCVLATFCADPDQPRRPLPADDLLPAAGCSSVQRQRGAQRLGRL